MKIKTITYPDCFTPFQGSIEGISIPKEMNSPFTPSQHALCLLAVKQLQSFIENQTWEHNFGLTPNADGPVIGKMFGVMIVQKSDSQIGYLSAFSGKIAGGNHHQGFVPPVYDALEEGSFLNLGMAELQVIGSQIKELKKGSGDLEKINALKEMRRDKSNHLQDLLFQSYIFSNNLGEQKGLIEIFKDIKGHRPPSAAGECAAPKLFQYAYLNDLKPLAITEFWWGQSPKSDQWKHRAFYPACEEKCRPILEWMIGEGRG